MQLARLVVSNWLILMAWKWLMEIATWKDFARWTIKSGWAWFFSLPAIGGLLWYANRIGKLDRYSLLWSLLIMVVYTITGVVACVYIDKVAVKFNFWEFVCYWSLFVLALQTCFYGLAEPFPMPVKVIGFLAFLVSLKFLDDIRLAWWAKSRNYSRLKRVCEGLRRRFGPKEPPTPFGGGHEANLDEIRAAGLL